MFLFANLSVGGACVGCLHRRLLATLKRSCYNLAWYFQIWEICRKKDMANGSPMRNCLKNFAIFFKDMEKLWYVKAAGFPFDRIRMAVRTSGWPLRAVTSVLDKTHGLGK